MAVTKTIYLAKTTKPNLNRFDFIGKEIFTKELTTNKFKFDNFLEGIN